MIRVSLGCSASGEFRKCIAEGHAGFAHKGRDIVCSAVTAILRTAGQVLSSAKDISVVSEAVSQGKLSFCVEDDGVFSEKTAIQLCCIADFIRSGISSIEKEYPKCVKLEEYRTDF
jgi:hypothetical protein